jgi:transposase-like protein
MKATRDEVKAAIIDYIIDEGRAPTMYDVAQRLGMGVTAIQARVVQLRREGFLNPEQRCTARALWPVELSEIIRDSARYMRERDQHVATTGGNA